MRFTCRSCKREVSAFLETSCLTAGYYAECPRCGAENTIKVKREEEMDCFDEINYWEEDVALPIA